MRYLELHLLHRCNLKCAHCYLGPSRPVELPLAHAVHITQQFSENGGLRLLISGGEPLVYKNLQAYIARTSELKVRRVQCKGCSALEDCRGGCRFRAPHPLAPDPVMCRLYGISE